MSECTVRQGSLTDCALIAPLFDAYRQFYGQAPDQQRAEAFLRERVSSSESVLFIAESGEEALGFGQLYPGFSSVRVIRTFILNDLFVAERARGKGVARMLIEAIEAFSRAAGVSSLSLSTATDNVRAQQLYRSLGWQLETGFLTFTRKLED